jgi:hypothetical protein
MLFRVIENHPNCPLTYFRWVTLLFVHDPILSNDGVSSKPGAIHLAIRKALKGEKYIRGSFDPPAPLPAIGQTPIRN